MHRSEGVVRTESRLRRRDPIGSMGGAATKQWETTFDAIQEGVCLIDADHCILRCNRAMSKILDAPRESLIGQDCCQAFRYQEIRPPECLITRVRESRQRETAMVRLRERLFAVAVDPVLDEADQFAGVVYTMSDMTAVYESEEARQTAEHELAARAYSVWLRTVCERWARWRPIAHELNQPLVGARGLAEHLLIGMERGWDIPAAKLRERLALIVDQPIACLISSNASACSPARPANWKSIPCN